MSIFFLGFSSCLFRRAEALLRRCGVASRFSPPPGHFSCCNLRRFCGSNRYMLPRVEQVPSLSVTCVRIFLATRADGYTSSSCQALHRKDIPEVLFQQVDGEIIDLLGGICLSFVICQAAVVTISGPAVGAFDLHALEAPRHFDSDIVASRVSVWLRDGKRQLRRPRHKQEFNPFPALLVTRKHFRPGRRIFLAISPQVSTSQSSLVIPNGRSSARRNLLLISSPKTKGATRRPRLLFRLL
jgi:hypothetical protein